jgi:DNA-binding GntR family transcriptional regulator
MRAVRDARGVVAAMHKLAVREAGPSLSEANLEAMREANSRFRSAIEQGDLEAALRADDELHAAPWPWPRTRALTAVLDQFTPVLRRAERLRFASGDARASLAPHDELIRLFAAGEADQAAAVAFDTFHSLPTTEELRPAAAADPRLSQPAALGADAITLANPPRP